jgi:hypothetical protein
MYSQQYLFHRWIARTIALTLFVCNGAVAQEVRLHVVPTHEDFSRILVATGVIASVDRRFSQVVLKPSKPFWGPVRRGSSLIALWPTQVQLSVAVGAMTPMTIDGKKCRFDDLAVGRNATIQYIIRAIPSGALDTLTCIGQRIDMTSSAPRSKTEGQKSIGQK